MVYLAHNNFTTVSQKADAHGLTHKQEAYIKELLLGKESRRNFKEILNRGKLWKDLVLLSDCGILLLAKQQISLLGTKVFGTVIQQYLCYVGDTEGCRNLVCDVFSAFSPTNRVSVSYYTRAYEELNDLITRESTSSRQSPHLALVVAKNPPTCPGSPEFENSTHDSFVAGKLQRRGAAPQDLQAANCAEHGPNDVRVARLNSHGQGKGSCPRL